MKRSTIFHCLYLLVTTIFLFVSISVGLFSIHENGLFPSILERTIQGIAATGIWFLVMASIYYFDHKE